MSDRMTDVEYLKAPGTASSVRHAVLTCPGVKDAAVFDDPGDGPWGVFAVLVVGGDESQVRGVIADSRPAGSVPLVRLVPPVTELELKPTIGYDEADLDLLQRVLAKVIRWGEAVWCALRAKPTRSERLALKLLERAYREADELRNMIPGAGR